MIAITKDGIDIEGLIAAAKTRKTGAIVTFVGTVRDDGIESLDVEVYEEVALRELEEIAACATEQFSLEGVDIVHRSGHLHIGDTIVVIVAAAGHRGDAFAGCRFVIEQLKERVPIWKQETGSSGKRWVPGEHPG